MKYRMKCESFRALARDTFRREWVTGITNAVNGIAVKTYALTRDPGGCSLYWDGRNRLVYAEGGEIDLYGQYMCG